MTLVWTRNNEVIEAPEGYNAYDYYPGIANLATATQAELDAAALGADVDGVECKVAATKVIRGQGLDTDAVIERYDDENDALNRAAEIGCKVYAQDSEIGVGEVFFLVEHE
jgi:hypothetical protein